MRLLVALALGVGLAAAASGAAGGPEVEVSVAPGAQDVLWDGTNQSGRVVAPGVYTAWLTGADKRRSVKLVRVP